MILDLSENKFLKLTFVFLIILSVFIAWAWLGGFIFVEISGLSGQKTSPITLYQYWTYYGNDKQIIEKISLAMLCSFLIFAVPIFLFFKPKKRELYGDAKWATFKEKQDAGLYEKSGIIVGQERSWFGLSKRYLVYGGTTSVLMAAPTRSGKGVAIAIPNLLTWGESRVGVDVKMENWNASAGYRSKHGQQCFLLNFAPRNLKTHRWNPLFYITNNSAFKINDIQKIGQMFFPKIDNEPPIWQSSARSLWLGIILYLLETEGLPVTMGEALRQITMGDERLEKKIAERQQGNNPVSMECYLALREFLDTPDKTRGSIRKSFTSALELFYNPVIDAATSGNDFDLRDLRKKRMSIYVGVTPDDLDRLAPLINLFFQQVIDINTRVLPEHDPTLKHQVLLLMDEFTALGRIAILSKGISYISGYGLRMLTIIQSPSQLDIYGKSEAENFIENHSLQIYFPPKSVRVAKELSDTIGTTTVKSKSRSRQLSGHTRRSESQSDHGRALLMPQEVRAIGQKSEILILENCPPVKCEKITWYKDKIFLERGNNRNEIKFPSPEIPIVDIDNNIRGDVECIPPNNTTKNDTVVVERAITAVDIENIESFDLSDFSCDFSQVPIPENDIQEEDVDNIVEGFFNGLEG